MSYEFEGGPLKEVRDGQWIVFQGIQYGVGEDRGARYESEIVAFVCVDMKDKTAEGLRTFPVKPGLPVGFMHTDPEHGPDWENGCIEEVLGQGRDTRVKCSIRGHEDPEFRVELALGEVSLL